MPLASLSGPQQTAPKKVNTGYNSKISGHPVHYRPLCIWLRVLTKFKVVSDSKFPRSRQVGTQNLGGF